jgi:hypothetical protein
MFSPFGPWRPIARHAVQESIMACSCWRYCVAGAIAGKRACEACNTSVLVAMGKALIQGRTKCDNASWAVLIGGVFVE